MCDVEENEEHVFLHCAKYTNLRQNLFDKIESVFPDFKDKPQADKLKVLTTINYGNFLTLNNEIGYFLKQTQDRQEPAQDRSSP